MGPHFLNIEGFSCGYGQKFALDNINISLPKGMFAGIIGPNGSGKTTLFKGLTTELQRRSGTIFINGHNLHSLNVRQKAQTIAIVTQTIENQSILVSDYVLLGRTPYRNRFSLVDKPHDIDIANHYMQLTGTWKFRNKYLDELSGGEQQLAAIARALTQEPQLLLLDEPTAHLDITHQVQVLNLLQKLNNQFVLTVLMIIHDLNLASEYCNYLIMLNKGKIHIQGTPADVLTYKTIEEVYHTVVVTRTNPMSGKPVIILVSDQVLNQKA
jgi:iron complex transport system ATP-binding protein